MNDEAQTPDASSPKPPSIGMGDTNLLLGILALQMDFVGRDQLVAAMHAWVLDKATPLGTHLEDAQVLTAEERTLLDALVAKHLERHNHDLGESLSAISTADSLVKDLQGADEDVIHATLSILPTANTAEIDGPSLPASDTQTRFKILRPHAKGGLGEVLVAQDLELNREVALKRIQSRHSGNAESQQRFVQEAEVTGLLEHPGVVPVYGLGKNSEGQPYYAMRLIKGQSLADAIESFHEQSGRSSPSDLSLELRGLLNRFVDVCNTIEYAHSRGILHRDIKPGNIMLGKYGETLVVDWGLAKPIGKAEIHKDSDEQTILPSSGDSSHTHAGSIVGTPAYMSPEQAAGDVSRLGPATDIYALGATLYTILVGRPAIEGKDLRQGLQAIQRGEFTPPRQADRTVPAALDAICLRAMATRPEDRYASAAALANDVERWLADEPPAAYREPWSIRLIRWARHNPSWIQTLLTVLVMVAVLSVAIPIAQRVGTLFRSGRLNPPQLGVVTSSDQLTEEGLLVLKVLPDSPADHAGIQPVKVEANGRMLGDVLLEIEGEELNTPDDLRAVLDRQEFGEVIRLKILRESRTQFLDVELFEPATMGSE